MKSRHAHRNRPGGERQVEGAGPAVPQDPASVLAQRWIEQFPEAGRGRVTAWFVRAVHQGATSPDAVLEKVAVLLGQKLEWSVELSSRQLCIAVQEGLRNEVDGALAYAENLLEEKA
jgi:hypothetical protein